MWRFDAGRTGASPEELAEDLQFEWVREYGPREPVWDDPLNRDLMPYDKLFEPVVLGDTLFLGFNDSDKVVALDTATGEERWRFYTDGPVRLPPVAGAKTVIFACDDGNLYCLDAADGALRWKFRGGPSARKVLGNKRLISTWPARGGPVLKDGVVYFAAGIWPFMGTFIYALDAATGDLVWLNDSTSAQWLLQPHNYAAFAGVAPQGAFVVAGDRLLVPGGRSVAACFDVRTGEYLYYRLADYGKSGGSFVCAADGVFYNHHREGIVTMYDLANGGQIVGRVGRFPVLAEGLCYTSGARIVAYDLAAMRRDPKQWQGAKRWEIDVDALGDLIKAGNCLYAAGDGHITAVALPGTGNEPQVAWRKDVDGTVGRLIAANGRLFAVTLEGRLLSFGAKAAGPRRLPLERKQAAAQASAEAKAILAQAGVTAGYALVYGAGDPGLLEALALGSDLSIVALEEDVALVDAMRRRLDARGLYGTRVAVHQVRGVTHAAPRDLLTFSAPSYMASLTVVGEGVFRLDTEHLTPLFRPMRPYGGVAWVALSGAERTRFLKLVASSGLPGARAVKAGDAVLLYRDGPLPGAAWWTHQYGNAANTVKSDDALVKAPLGLLWFGGNSNMDVLPRHGHGPPEQVIGGRLFIEGMDCLSARDVYTGRVLWKAELGDLGTFGAYYDKTYANTPTSTAYNQIHIPGANSRGTNFVATLDKVYILQGGHCHVLDAASGERMDTFALPGAAEDNGPAWGYIGVYEDTLVAGSDFVAFSDVLPEEATAQVRERDRAKVNFDNVASAQLIVMDRQTGAIRWNRVAEHGFIHNGIAIANDTLFCLDKMPPFVEQALRRRGAEADYETFRLLALDLATGEVKWETNEHVFGSWLGYSDEHDVLLHATRPSPDMVWGENGRRMIAYRGADGTPLWDNAKCSYNNPPILHGDKIITNSSVYNLLTGEPAQRVHPLTGESVPWTYDRTKGCNYSIASEHLLTFRSSAASYYDLVLDGGTGHFGGFKSGCTSNLIVADGVLNAPDYTRTCSCAFQNQSSLALIHDPDIEVWTTFPKQDIRGRIQRLGINLGAPGDRRADDGTLWIEYPVVGGPSPRVDITLGPDIPGMVSRGAVWKYLDDGSEQGTAWREPGFDDSAWASGPAELGYGDGDEVTVVGYGPDGKNKHITTYFRHTFKLDAAPAYDTLALEVKRDDGAVVYLNGAEVFRVGMPAGQIDYKTLATGGESWEGTTLDASVLKVGTNVLAVEMHQKSGGSSDISFDLELAPVPEGPQYLLHHSSYMEGDGPRGAAWVTPRRWIGASGAEGLTHMTVALAPGAEEERAYTVRLYFAELRDLEPGQRVFSVWLQGTEVLSDFDIAATAGGARRTVVREFGGVRVRDALTVGLAPTDGSPVQAPLLCGLEMASAPT